MFWKKKEKRVLLSADIIDSISHGALILYFTKAWCEEWDLYQNETTSQHWLLGYGVVKQLNIYEAECQNVSKEEKNWNKYSFQFILRNNLGYRGLYEFITLLNEADIHESDSYHLN